MEGDDGMTRASLPPHLSNATSAVSDLSNSVFSFVRRRTEKEGADGMMHANVQPYLMDLGSVNGTFLNNERVEGERYYELLEQVGSWFKGWRRRY